MVVVNSKSYPVGALLPSGLGGEDVCSCPRSGMGMHHVVPALLQPHRATGAASGEQLTNMHIVWCTVHTLLLYACTVRTRAGGSNLTLVRQKYNNVGVPKVLDEYLLTFAWEI